MRLQELEVVFGQTETNGRTDRRTPDGQTDMEVEIVI